MPPSPFHHHLALRPSRHHATPLLPPYHKYHSTPPPSRCEYKQNDKGNCTAGPPHRPANQPCTGIHTALQSTRQHGPRPGVWRVVGGARDKKGGAVCLIGGKKKAISKNREQGRANPKNRGRMTTFPKRAHRTQFHCNATKNLARQKSPQRRRLHRSIFRYIRSHPSRTIINR